MHSKLVSVLSNLKTKVKYEIIFVDDGSKDKTFAILKTLKPVKIIRFRKNFGQTPAMVAGIRESQGKIIVMMEGELQNDPADIPRLLNKMKEGYDVVSGRRERRRRINNYYRGFHRSNNF